MFRFAILVMFLSLAACATYKIEADGEIVVDHSQSDFLTIVKVNEWAEGKHCFEPLLFVLTLGIIPTHCVDTYSIMSQEQELGTYEVTYMQGWVALLIAPFPDWKYGYGTEIEAELIDASRGEQ